MYHAVRTILQSRRVLSKCFLREDSVSTNGYTYLGHGRKAIDGFEKVAGRARYAGDVQLPNMLYARPVLSPYAHAQIMSIDVSTAQRMPGVAAVLTADDLRSRNRAINSRNSAILAKDRVVFRGQPVVLVLAESEAQARDAADAVVVEYSPLPVVADLEAALADGAPLIWPNGLPKEGTDMTAAHTTVDKAGEDKEQVASNIHGENHYTRGNIEAGFQAADVVIERRYVTRAVHQGYLEPHAAVADPDPIRQTVTVYTSTQGQFQVRKEVAELLNLPKRNVRIVPMTVGGGFGAKYGIIDPLVAAAALAVGRPVRLVLTRSEDFLATTPSPATIIELKMGATKDGSITALQARILMDNGAFPFKIGGLVGILLGGYYKCDNLKIDAYEVFTNTAPTGAYRAPGAPQVAFALDSTIEDVARAIGMDSLEFRLKNAVEAGDRMGNNDKWPTIGLKDCLEQLRNHPAWQNRGNNPDEGVGIAVGGWPGAVSPAAAVCRMDSDGNVMIHVGSVDISGVHSSLVLVAAEVLQVDPDQVILIAGDTEDGPFAPGSGGSQTTYSVAAAVEKAAQDVRQQLIDLAAEHFEANPADLELKAGKVNVRGVPDRSITLANLASQGERKRGGAGPIVGDGRAAVRSAAPGFVVHLARVRVDRETGQVTPLEYVAIQDVGFAMNPMMVDGQVHGGVAQGIGWGLYEGMVYDDHGQLLSGSLMDYSLPRADMVPAIESILVQVPSEMGPFGSRGVGEPPIVPGAGALANAIYDATGVRLSELPIREATLWNALQQNTQA
jgi:CO/xanthine dehydrogenase Mo-binding subunit